MHLISSFLSRNEIEAILGFPHSLITCDNYLLISGNNQDLDERH